MTHQLSILTRPTTATLTGCNVAALGSRVHVAAEGTDGRRALVLPVETYPPRQDPCPGCEHRTRPECVTVTGCPTAEGWAAAQRAYSAAESGEEPSR